MDPISLEELALLDVLMSITHFSDQHHSAPLRARLIEGGLVEEGEDALELTDAGVQRCKSLHHRVAADAEAAAVLKKREEADEAEAEEPVSAG